MKMTRSTTAEYLKPDFDSFLYAEIGKEKDGRPISVLSALARQNVDPWHEAAKFDRLQIEPATERLVALVSTLPGGSAAQQLAAETADRLISLLPHMGHPLENPRTGGRSTTKAGNSNAVMLAVIYLIILSLFLFSSH